MPGALLKVFSSVNGAKARVISISNIINHTGLRVLETRTGAVTPYVIFYAEFESARGIALVRIS